MPLRSENISPLLLSFPCTPWQACLSMRHWAGGRGRGWAERGAEALCVQINLTPDVKAPGCRWCVSHWNRQEKKSGRRNSSSKLKTDACRLFSCVSPWAYRPISFNSAPSAWLLWSDICWNDSNHKMCKWEMAHCTGTKIYDVWLSGLRKQKVTGTFLDIKYTDLFGINNVIK